MLAWRRLQQLHHTDKNAQGRLNTIFCYALYLYLCSPLIFSYNCDRCRTIPERKLLKHSNILNTATGAEMRNTYLKKTIRKSKSSTRFDCVLITAEST